MFRARSDAYAVQTPGPDCGLIDQPLGCLFAPLRGLQVPGTPVLPHKQQLRIQACQLLFLR